MDGPKKILPPEPPRPASEPPHPPLPTIPTPGAIGKYTLFADEGE